MFPRNDSEHLDYAAEALWRARPVDSSRSFVIHGPLAEILHHNYPTLYELTGPICWQLDDPLEPGEVSYGK